LKGNGSASQAQLLLLLNETHDPGFFHQQFTPLIFALNLGIASFVSF
jgi:hypothetical protein